MSFLTFPAVNTRDTSLTAELCCVMGLPSPTAVCNKPWIQQTHFKQMPILANIDFTHVNILFSLIIKPILSLQMLRALGKSKLKAAGKEPSPLQLKTEENERKMMEEELPADFITYPCLPYTHIWNQNLDTDNLDIQRGLLLFIHSKSCWNFYSWSSSCRQFGDLKISGTSLSSLQMTLYMAFFQEGSTSLPAIMALKNSRNVICATSRNLSGTCWYKETMALIKFSVSSLQFFKGNWAKVFLSDRGLHGTCIF